MKKLLAVIALLIIALIPLFALSHDNQAMTVTGFVSQIHTVSVISVMTEEINLDYSTTSDLLITPTAAPETQAGMRVATWSLISNCLQATLTISHDKLVNTINNTYAYDYELALENNFPTGCTVSNPANTTGGAVQWIATASTGATNDEEIKVTLPAPDSGVRTYSIQNLGMYFRLCKINNTIDSSLIQDGEYTSTVTFTFIGQ
ncbi:MAG: hypothetical protein PHT39_02635 [Sphaerochaetaceae bacterium]|nr:hypothetical protein [Sphaerochaetaceae bacterium]MDD3163593.1 hypothetical protein [Sphaerochaetaceae bacterium]MDD4396453.1 hypothetical protein [Sphaerochaetaceae bacterium]